MNNDALSRWASIAEMIAAIGVILSLIFIGMQINEGNREARAATLQAANDSEMFMQSQLLRYADVWEKMNAGQPLESGAETRPGIVLYKLAMTEYENRFNQLEAGFLDPKMWATRMSGLRRLVALPFFDIWRPSIGATRTSPDSLERIDNLRQSKRQ